MSKIIKLTLVCGLTSLFLTGCGSSTEEEQIAWINQWESSTQYGEANHRKALESIKTCYKGAGVKSITSMMTDSQNKEFTECRLDFVKSQADEDGITLEDEIIISNMYEFQF
ncbi:hypothetical protein AB4209_12165 [Vibrio sp. 10N.286.48.C11]|uniref:hypothetical protein n=1 Tax=Vibrio sp. 10N.286.48.C11 TaxID=3229698 RepID=UPI00354D41D6